MLHAKPDPAFPSPSPRSSSTLDRRQPDHSVCPVPGLTVLVRARALMLVLMLVLMRLCACALMCNTWLFCH